MISVPQVRGDVTQDFRLLLNIAFEGEMGYTLKRNDEYSGKLKKGMRC